MVNHGTDGRHVKSKVFLTMRIYTHIIYVGTYTRVGTAPKGAVIDRKSSVIHTHVYTYIYVYVYMYIERDIHRLYEGRFIAPPVAPVVVHPRPPCGACGLLPAACHGCCSSLLSRHHIAFSIFP